MGLWARSLVGKLRPHVTHSRKTKTYKRSNTGTYSIKALKMVHISKFFKIKTNEKWSPWVLFEEHQGVLEEEEVISKWEDLF